MLKSSNKHKSIRIYFIELFVFKFLFLDFCVKAVFIGEFLSLSLSTFCTIAIAPLEANVRYEISTFLDAISSLNRAISHPIPVQ